MARIQPDTHVTMQASGLVYPPPGGATLVVAAHPAVLKVPNVALTTLAALDKSGDVVWVGSVDEALLTTSGGSTTGAREHLAKLLLSGPKLWRVVRPGSLRATKRADTVYHGDRPWVVLGGPCSCGLLAAPLNDRGVGNLRPYQCGVDGNALNFAGSKDSKLELNHVWAFPETVADIGDVDNSARATIEAAVRKEFPV